MINRAAPLTVNLSFSDQISGGVDAANFENVDAYASTGVSLTGDNGNDNYLNSGSGNDTLSGGSGNDILVGRWQGMNIMFSRGDGMD